MWKTAYIIHIYTAPPAASDLSHTHTHIYIIYNRRSRGPSLNRRDDYYSIPSLSLSLPSHYLSLSIVYIYTDTHTKVRRCSLRLCVCVWAQGPTFRGFKLFIGPRGSAGRVWGTVHRAAQGVRPCVYIYIHFFFVSPCIYIYTSPAILFCADRPSWKKGLF